MARSYKRDGKGRFSRASARRSAKKKARADYRHGKKFNRKIAAYAVHSGNMTSAQARSRLRVVQAKEKAAYKSTIKSIKRKK